MLSNTIGDPPFKNQFTAKGAFFAGTATQRLHGYLFAHDLSHYLPFLLLPQGEDKKGKNNKKEKAEDKREHENVKEVGKKIRRTK